MTTAWVEPRAAPTFKGRIIMIGCGSIGQAVLPVIGRHLEGIYGRLTVLSADESGRGIAERCGAQFIHCHLTPANYRTTLKNHVRDGDLMLNLSIDISSADLIRFCAKRALIDLDQIIRNGNAKPSTREEWANLACDLRISTILISERDTQASQRPKRQGEFINTWSIDGFVDELMQPAELSFGTFEKRRPRGAREHRPGSGTLYLGRPGASTFARSWVPSIGGFQGMLVTHDEVFSIADYLSIRDRGAFLYRPSVMYVYHPCDDAMLSALELEGSGWILQPSCRRPGADIVEGMDELGVLLTGHERNAYWYGSQLAIQEARRHVAYANATTVQVTAGAVAAVLWAIRNPRRGVVEPEDLDFEDCLETAVPYLGRMVGEFTDWTPLNGRGRYFPEKLDVQSPWQLQNVRSRQWYGE